jgi:hypothetical protein
LRLSVVTVLKMLTTARTELEPKVAVIVTVLGLARELAEAVKLTVDCPVRTVASWGTSRYE